MPPSPQTIPRNTPFSGKVFFCPTEGLRRIGTNHKHLRSVKKNFKGGRGKLGKKEKCMSSYFSQSTHSESTHVYRVSIWDDEKVLELGMVMVVEYNECN